MAISSDPDRLLLTFRSDADADILIYRKHAEPILKLLGKDLERGILTPEELPAAIAILEAAAAEERARAQQALRASHPSSASPDAETEASIPIGFHQRVWPLLQMMKRALAEQKPILWGL
ncbi:MAG: DUF1840 family protein [Hydrogenophilus sp.]|nr:DUF1840 family protein [Hydrogenophilus sp.]